MSTQKGSKHTLGVMVTGRAIHAALLEQGADGVKVIRRFMRQRTARFSAAQTALPDLNTSDDPTEFSIQFTDSGSSSMENMFIGGEFGGLEMSGHEGFGEQKEQASAFVLELGDILAECRVDPRQLD